jgi:pseudouridine synthase
MKTKNKMNFPLQKFISQSGYCSRRKAEKLIRNGKVFVNDKIAELGQRVSEEDIIKINNKLIKVNKEKTYVILNKPRDYTCTTRKFKNEQNIFELLPEEYNNLHIVGRLDKNSRGLVLLTNDGDLSFKITHPKFEHKKIYIVRIKNEENIRATKELGERNKEIIKTFQKGIDIGDNDGIVKVKNIKTLSANKFEITLSEGKKRQIRRMFETLDLKVSDLKRISIGKIELGDLKEGKWEEIKI